MSEQREILDLSFPAYMNMFPQGIPDLFVPESWRIAFGRMYEPQEEGVETPPVEIVPTFHEYITFIGDIGGKKQIVSPVADGKWERVQLEDATAETRVGIVIPWDRVSAEADITQMKQDLDETLAVYGAKWYSSLLKFSEWKKKYPMKEQEL